MGLHMADLECLSYGEVLDLMVESGNDNAEYNELATQEDMNNF